jgi:hypothetical protein
MAVGLVVGLIIGRWWAPLPVAVVTAVVLWIWGRDSILDPGIKQGLAEVFGLAAGLGALAGVTVRRFVKPS